MKLTRYTSKAIREWLENNGFGCRVNLGYDFYYEPNEDKIVISRNYNENCDFDFMHCLRALGLKNNFDSITLSVLHEIGHYMTIDDFSAKKWEKDSRKKDKLATRYSGQKLNELYWECPTEKSANEWLVEYVNNNPNEVQDLEDKISITIIW